MSTLLLLTMVLVATIGVTTTSLATKVNACQGQCGLVPPGPPGGGVLPTPAQNAICNTVVNNPSGGFGSGNQPGEDHTDPGTLANGRGGNTCTT